MGHVQAALRFSEWAMEFMVVPPFCFVSPLVAVSFVWAGLTQRPFQARLWKPYHWLVLTHLLFFPAAIVVGVLFANAVTDPSIVKHADRSAVLWLNTLSYGSLASSAFWIWRMKGFRWCASSLMALIELPTLGALFVASMSATGDWL
jgi:hypothetical protein